MNFKTNSCKNKSKLQLQSDVFEHFQEMRFKVDEQGEELKKRIDDIALELIDKIKKSEEIFLRQLGEKISSFDGRQSLETELNEIQETFRNPTLLIETIREMQHKQEEFLRDIQSKLNQINQVKDDAKDNTFFHTEFIFIQSKRDVLI